MNQHYTNTQLIPEIEQIANSGNFIASCVAQCLPSQTYLKDGNNAPETNNRFALIYMN